MLRIICCDVNCGAAANVGGPVHTAFKTFDVDAPEVEAFLLEFVGKGGYTERSVTGVEILPPDTTGEGEGK